jgi:hypothetical protein
VYYEKKESGGKEATTALQVQVKEPGFRRRRVMFFALIGYDITVCQFKKKMLIFL